MEILNMEQGTEEWFAARLGSLGGSSIADATAGGKGIVRKNLMYRLIGELLSGQKAETYQNAYMKRGNELEPFAREAYQNKTGREVEQVGLCRKAPFKHASPDGIIYDKDIRGVLEIKCVIPATHIRYIDEDRIPLDYNKQTQWELHCCEAEFVDFVSYCPEIKDYPLWVKTGYRDEKLIKELDQGADRFLEAMLAIIEKVTR